MEIPVDLCDPSWVSRIEKERNQAKRPEFLDIPFYFLYIVCAIVFFSFSREPHSAWQYHSNLRQQQQQQQNQFQDNRHPMLVRKETLRRPSLPLKLPPPVWINNSGGQTSKYPDQKTSPTSSADIVRFPGDRNGVRLKLMTTRLPPPGYRHRLPINQEKLENPPSNSFHQHHHNKNKRRRIEPAVKQSFPGSVSPTRHSITLSPQEDKHTKALAALASLMRTKAKIGAVSGAATTTAATPMDFKLEPGDILMRTVKEVQEEEELLDFQDGAEGECHSW